MGKPQKRNAVLQQLAVELYEKLAQLCTWRTMRRRPTLPPGYEPDPEPDDRFVAVREPLSPDVGQADLWPPSEPLKVGDEVVSSGRRWKVARSWRAPW